MPSRGYRNISTFNFDTIKIEESKKKELKQMEYTLPLMYLPCVKASTKYLLEHFKRTTVSLDFTTFKTF